MRKGIYVFIENWVFNFKMEIIKVDTCLVLMVYIRFIVYREWFPWILDNLYIRVVSSSWILSSGRHSLTRAFFIASKSLLSFLILSPSLFLYSLQSQRGARLINIQQLLWHKLRNKATYARERTWTWTCIITDVRNIRPCRVQAIVIKERPLTSF